MNNSSDMNCNNNKFIFSPDGLCNGMFSRLFRICKYDEHYKILKNENTTLSHNKKKLEEQIIVLLDKIVCCDQKNVTLKNEVIAKNNDITGMKKEIQHLLLSNTSYEDRVFVLEEQSKLDFETINKSEQDTLSLQLQLETLQIRHENSEEKLHNYQQKYSDSEIRLSVIQEELSCYKEQLDVAKKDITLLTEEMQTANDQTNRCLIKLTEYQHELTITEQCVNDVTTELRTLEQTHLYNVNVLASSNKTIGVLEHHIDTLQKQLTLSEETVTCFHTKLINYKHNHSVSNDQYHNIEQLCFELQNTYSDTEATKNMVTRKLTTTTTIDKELCKEVDFLLNQHTTYNMFHIEESYERCW